MENKLQVVAKPAIIANKWYKFAIIAIIAGLEGGILLMSKIQASHKLQNVDKNTKLD